MCIIPCIESYMHNLLLKVFSPQCCTLAVPCSFKQQHSVIVSWWRSLLGFLRAAAVQPHRCYASELRSTCHRLKIPAHAHAYSMPCITVASAPCLSLAHVACCINTLHKRQLGTTIMMQQAERQVVSSTSSACCLLDVEGSPIQGSLIATHSCHVCS